MPDISKRVFFGTFCVALLLLTACATRPGLTSKPAGVPLGIDLSGNWQIRQNPGALRLPNHGRATESILQSSSHGGRRERRKPPGNPVDIFLEYGESLKITQTYFGLFISYDRSVVEEYTYGENRRIAIGPVEAQRVSGWDGTSFVVETLDASGATLFETWKITEDGQVLARSIRISKSDKDLFSAKQIFDRT